MESPVADSHTTTARPSGAASARAWEDAIRSQLATRLPSLMVPTRILAVDSLVRTPSGKVDRTRLKAQVRMLLHESGSAIPRPSPGDLLGSMIDDLRVVLDRSDIGPDDDFFALGGHSLQGVHLVARIRERTGIELPLRVLLDASTARTLVTVLAQPDGTAEVTPLVRFGAAVSDRRLYLVHGAGGHVLGFRDLALAMRSDVELVGIQARGIEPGRPADRTLDEMAERYVAAILADDPDGPYDLGGYSDGGTIAIRLAHELQRHGREVRSLVLLDTFVLRPLRATRLGRLANVVRNATDRSGQPFASWARNGVAAWRARHSGIDAPAERAAALGYIGLGDTIEQAVSGAAMLAPLDIPTLLVRSTFHNPVHIFDYAVAAASSTDLTNAWIDAPHLEVFEARAVEALSPTITGFLRRVSLRPIDVAAPIP